MANQDGASNLEALSFYKAEAAKAKASPWWTPPTMPTTQYWLLISMCEVKCGATMVGSIVARYGDLCSTKHESSYTKIYILCLKKNKILVFALGSREEAGSAEINQQ